MKIKIKNIPLYSHEYLVTDKVISEVPKGGLIEKYKLGINKYLIVTTVAETKVVEFQTPKKIIKIPFDWFEIIN